MPSKSPKLANVIIKNFEDWIRIGAPDPRTTKPTKEDLANQVDWESERDRRKEWGGFQPLKKLQAPSAKQPEWNGIALGKGPSSMGVFAVAGEDEKVFMGYFFGGYLWSFDFG